MQNDNLKEQIQFDDQELFQEFTYTDRKVGSIKMLKPVNQDGETDESREVIFVGQSQMMTPMGALPLNFEIDAQTLNEAIANFPEAAERSVNETVEELKRLQREQASSIVLPGQGQSPMSMPNGNNIQIP